MSWTDTINPLQTKIRSIHVTELRAAIDSLASACATHNAGVNSSANSSVNSTNNYSVDAGYTRTYSTAYTGYSSSGNSTYHGGICSSHNAST